MSPVTPTFTSLIEPHDGDRDVALVATLPVRSDADGADVHAVSGLTIKLVKDRRDHGISSVDREHTTVIHDRFAFRDFFAVVCGALLSQDAGDRRPLPD